MFHLHGHTQKTPDDKDILTLESEDSKKGFLVKKCTAYENGCIAFEDEHLCIVGQGMTNYYVLIDQTSPHCGGNLTFESWKLDPTRSSKNLKIYTAKITRQRSDF